MKWMVAAVFLAAVAGTATYLFATSGPDYARLLKEAAFTLPEAIDKGMKEAGTGTVVKAEIEEENGKIIYSMDVAQGDKILEVNLDVRDGKLVAKDEEKEDQSKLVKAFKITLRQAIETAVKKSPGKAVKARLRMDQSKPVAEVRIWGDAKLRQVRVNGETGEVLGVEDVKPGKKGMKDDDDDDDDD